LGKVDVFDLYELITFFEESVEISMNKFPPFCITFFLLIASSALSQHVDCEFSNRVDFSKFKTYKWVIFKNAAPIDKLTDEQIKAALDAALARKGLTNVNSDGTADLLIGYQTSELKDEEFSHQEAPQEIYAGDLAIDMYTPADHHLVWREVASKTLDPKAKPEKRQKNLDKAVAKLVNNYPPNGKSSCRLDSDM
jgi:hypothetical protein